MPTPGQIDPYYLRERSVMETDEQYAKRMAELDKREAFFKSLPTYKTSEKTDGR